MSETGKELLPLEHIKRIEFESTGDMDIFEYNNSHLTEEQRRTLEEKAEFVFVFGAHGTDPENFLAVEKVFDQIDPDDSVICFESAGFSLGLEKQIRNEAKNAKTSERMKKQREAILKSRNSVGGNYLTATNAFYYAQEFCLANGFDVHFADMDKWTEFNLINAFKSAGFEQDNVINYNYFANEWKQQTLVEAVQAWKQINNTSSMFIDNGGVDPVVIPRWGRYHAIREEHTVDRVVSLALNKLENKDLDKETKLKIVTFFGSGHTRGIQQKFSDRGIGLKCIHTHNRPFITSAEDVDIDMHDVRSFMSQWTSFQLYSFITPNPSVQQTESSVSFDDQVEATKRAVELMPADSLFELYESFRSALNYYEKPADKNETPLAKALREYKSTKVNPSTILQSLLLDAMHKNGMPLEEATNQYINERSKARAELFGQQ
jgi:hypothetical protein